MNINKEMINENEMIVIIEGRLDTSTSPKFEEKLNESYGSISKLIIDLSALEYISSAGLRVLLTAQKTMNQQGSMTIKGVSSDIMSIFEVTGFVDILNIE